RPRGLQADGAALLLHPQHRLQRLRRPHRAHRRRRGLVRRARGARTPGGAGPLAAPAVSPAVSLGGGAASPGTQRGRRGPGAGCGDPGGGDLGEDARRWTWEQSRSRSLSWGVGEGKEETPKEPELEPELLFLMQLNTEQAALGRFFLDSSFPPAKGSQGRLLLQTEAELAKSTLPRCCAWYQVAKVQG
ncbi:hypothetical protein U0070_006231, partial [Myodes glareolus]